MRWPDGWTVLPVEGVSVEVSAPPFNAECRWPTKENRRDVSMSETQMPTCEKCWTANSSLLGAVAPLAPRLDSLTHRQIR